MSDQGSFDFSEFQSAPVSEPANGIRDRSDPPGWPSQSESFDDNPEPARGFDGFNDTAAPFGPIERSVNVSPPQPPVFYLAAAMVAVLVALVIAALPGLSGYVYLAAWAISGPLAIGLLAVYSMRATAASAHTYYSPPAWTTWAYIALIVGAFLVCLLCALRCAIWVGHL